jgi:hypothetical protein
LLKNIGESPSGKATGFDPVIRGFESLFPNIKIKTAFFNKSAIFILLVGEGFERTAVK